jgi:RND family efflux transporter MFP subunit
MRQRQPANPSRAPTPRYAAILALVLLLPTACAKPEPTAAPPKPVRVQPVVLSDAEWEETFTGVVRARVESDLAFRVGGKIVQRFVDVGQSVEAGAPIAQIDAADYNLALEAVRNQLAAAQVDAAQAASDEARFRQLMTEGAVSEGDHERQKARADAARERVEQAARQVELARNRTSYALLRAPFDGVVTAVRLEVGQVVAEGQPVAALAAQGDREIVVDLPEHRAAALRGTTAVATLWTADDRPFPVLLRELSPLAADATRTYRARFRVGAGAPPMALGMTATVCLRLPVERAVARLPASALHQHEGEPAVWRLDAAQGRVELVRVEVVRYRQEEVDVAGLTHGALIATAGTQKLDTALRVAAVDAAGRPIAADAGPRLARAER